MTAHPHRLASAALLCMGAALLSASSADSTESRVPKEAASGLIPKDCAVPLRNPKKYVGDWQRVEAPTGLAQGPFGSISWTKKRVEIDVKAGYVLDLCVSEDLGGGIVYAEDFSVAGPDSRTKAMSAVFVVGYGAVDQADLPMLVDAGR